MKEVLAILRPNKINATKAALSEAGFPAFTCMKVQGRGKKPYSYTGETSPGHKMMPKRIFTLILPEEDVKRAVDVIMRVNHSGRPGDGKIFVLPVGESCRVRNGEGSADAY